MAPRKQSASSASTRKSSKSSVGRTSASSETTASRPSPTKVTKPTRAKPWKTPTEAQAKALEGVAFDKNKTSTRQNSSPRKHAHFVEDGDGFMNVDHGTSMAVDNRMSPRKGSASSRTSPIKQNTSVKSDDVFRPTSDKPNKASFRLENRGPRAAGKPDPAVGTRYEVERDGEIICDLRQTHSYLHQYNDLYDGVHELQENIEELARSFTGGKVDSGTFTKEVWLLDLDENMSSELQRYVGFLAVGGPCGIAGWEEVFLNTELRVALVAAIVWKALKEHVFEALWFGANRRVNQELEELEIDMKGQECGFIRNAKRAKRLRDISELWRGTGFPNTQQNETELALGIYHLIAPLADFENASDRVTSSVTGLKAIVKTAVKLHRFMRLDGDAIYIWATTPKDWPYSSEFARISSESHWNWLFDPQNRASNTVANKGVNLSEAQASRVQKYAFLSRIVVFEPLEAYRKGGWRSENHSAGFRRKLICKGAVACRWGATRQFGKKASAGEGEFLELRECRGKLGRDHDADSDPWWEHEPHDPAAAANSKNVPVLGKKGETFKKDLTDFKPRWWAHV